MPTDLAHSLSDPPISLVGENNDGAPSCDMEIPAIVLESLRPSFEQSSEETGSKLVGEDTRSGSLELMSDMSMDGQPFELIDLTGKD